MGLVSGDPEMALRQFNILKMGEDAVSPGCCLCVTECKKSIIILQLSAGCDLETGADSLLSFANHIINKRQTSAQIGEVLHYKLRKKKNMYPSVDICPQSAGGDI